MKVALGISVALNVGVLILLVWHYSMRAWRETHEDLVPTEVNHFPSGRLQARGVSTRCPALFETFAMPGEVEGVMVKMTVTHITQHQGWRGCEWIAEEDPAAERSIDAP